MSEVTQEAVNQQVDNKQRTAYMKITKENNAVLKLEAEKWELMFKTLYYKDQVSIMEQQMMAKATAVPPISIEESQPIWSTPDGEHTINPEDSVLESAPVDKVVYVADNAPVNPADIDHVN